MSRYHNRVDGFKEQIDLLRKFRSRPVRDNSITELVKSFEDRANQAQRKSGLFIDVICSLFVRSFPS